MTGVDSYGADRGLHAAVPVDPLGYARAMYRGGESTARRERYKRPFDLAVLALAGVGLLPLWLVLGAAIALALRLESRGPVLYRQLRLGRGGRVFAMLKFRTMAEGAEAGTGPVWPSERDGRTTAVGRVLRRFHLDELPQVVHVLRGEMSLVGPRPERPELAERIERAVPGFGERLRVRPGIAGLAQARGADHVDLAKQAVLRQGVHRNDGAGAGSEAVRALRLARAAAPAPVPDSLGGRTSARRNRGMRPRGRAMSRGAAPRPQRPDQGNAPPAPRPAAVRGNDWRQVALPAARAVRALPCG